MRQQNTTRITLILIYAEGITHGEWRGIILINLNLFKLSLYVFSNNGIKIINSIKTFKLSALIKIMMNSDAK